MNLQPSNHKPDRRGTVIVLVALMMIPLLAMVAFAVDYGYLLRVRTDLQRTADAAALAAVQDLVPDSDGNQDLAAVRSAVGTYAISNRDSSFQVLDADIEIGRYDPATIYSAVSILTSGTYDTVRVTVRNDSSANSPVSLFFSRILGIDSAPVTASACAVLQKAQYLEPGTNILPFVMPLDVWNGKNYGESWSVFGDGKLEDSSGNTIPGNWGTIDVGSTSNGTSELNDQILNGLRQSDLDALHSDGRISTNAHIDGNQQAWMQVDPGLSSGIKNSIQQIHGQKRMVPIYDTMSGQLNGNNAEISVVGWGVIEVVDSNWEGAQNTYVTIRKSYTYDGDLRPNPDLSNTTDIIDAVYTTPVLVE